jgi:hypothetical protein
MGKSRSFTLTKKEKGRQKPKHMTLNELKSDVAALGFESSLEDDGIFLASVNRALGLIYTDRPVSKTIIIHFDAPKVAFKKEFIEHHSNEEITIPINGRGISFRTTGDGECIIKDSSGSSLVIFSSKNQLTKKRLRSSGTITFSGNFYYTISNLVVFEDLRSENLLDIGEYSPRKEALPTDYCKDFRAFAGPPKNINGETVSEAELRDGRISVPYDFVGDIYLTYYRAPDKITNANADTAIDIGEECAPLLPLLTASFLWLDDDAAKAQYYMSLYRDSMANIRRYSTVRLDNGYGVNGWA